MPLKSVLPIVAVGAVCLLPYPGTEAGAAGLFSFGKKENERPSRVPSVSHAPGDTVFQTKYGPMTAAQFQERIRLEQEKAREAVRRAEERRQAEAAAKARIAAQAAREAAEEQQRAETLARKQAEEAKKRAEKEARELAERRQAEESARAQAEARARAAEAQALAQAEKAAKKSEAEKSAKDSRQKGSAARATSSPADRSPAETMAAMERIARDLAAQRKGGSGRTEITSAAKLGLAPADAQPVSAGPKDAESRIDSLNRAIFNIVGKRKGEPAATPPAATPSAPGREGELHLTTKSRTPFYYFNPLQMVLPDLFLARGTRVELVKKGKIWSDVRLEDGKVGVIANDFLEEAPVFDLFLPDGNALATAHEFKYSPLPRDYVPPALPAGYGSAELRASPLLLPPLAPSAP